MIHDSHCVFSDSFLRIPRDIEAALSVSAASIHSGPVIRITSMADRRGLGGRNLSTIASSGGRGNDRNLRVYTKLLYNSQQITISTQY